MKPLIFCLELLILLFLKKRMIEGLRSFRIAKSFQHSNSKMNFQAEIIELPSESVATFLDMKTSPKSLKKTKSLDSTFFSHISCNLNLRVLIDGIEFAVGVPIDSPVLITKLESTKLVQVDENCRNYSEIFDFIARNLDQDDLYLYKSAFILTLKGKVEEHFETHSNNKDDKFMVNLIDEIQRKKLSENDILQRLINGDNDPTHALKIDNLELSDGGERQEIVNKVFQKGLDSSNNNQVAIKNFARDIEKRDIGHFDKEILLDKNLFTHYEDGISVLNVDVASLSSSQFKELFPPHIKSIDQVKMVPKDAMVEEKDTKKFHRDHILVDRITQLSEGLSLIGSFHYKKNNYHLLNVLDVRDFYFFVSLLIRYRLISPFFFK